ncbi:hypothetical protein HDU81_004256 [Chytriomyces hyalinus]|nr:hypothetical protein HDU81_004256 [Chytriomyces hyalinus]
MLTAKTNYATHVQQLQTKAKSLKTCKTDTALLSQLTSLETTLHAFSSSVNDGIQEMNAKNSQLAATLQSQTQSHAAATSDLSMAQTLKHNASARMENLASQASSLQTTVHQEQSEVSHLNRRIEEEEKKRVDALTDLIPGVGFIGGLITGRHERMIPFHSAVNGIISAVKQDKENAEHRLNSTRGRLNALQEELDSYRHQADVAMERYEDANNRVKAANAMIKQLDSDIKKLGKLITDVSNFKRDLQLLDVRIAAAKSSCELAIEMDGMPELVDDLVMMVSKLDIKCLQSASSLRLEFTGAVPAAVTRATTSNAGFSGNAIYGIGSISSRQFLDGRAPGMEDVILSCGTRDPRSDHFLQWKIIPLHNNRYAIKSVSSGQYLDGRNPGMEQLILSSGNRVPATDVYLQWLCPEVGDGMYGIRSVSSGQWLDGRAPGMPDVILSDGDRVPEHDHFLQWMIREL